MARSLTSLSFRSAPAAALRPGLRILPVIVWVVAAVAAQAADSRVMVGEDIYVGADEVVEQVICVGGTARIEGAVTDEVIIIGGTLELRGQAADVVVVAGNALLDGEVQRDIVLVATTAEFRETARVGGDLVLVGTTVPNVASIPVGGSVTSAGWVGEVAFWGALTALAVALLLGILAGPLLVLLSYSLLGERRVVVMAETIGQRPGMSFVLGLALTFGFMLTWSISMLLGLSLFGMDTVLFVISVVVLVAGYTGLSLWVGRGLVSSSPFAATAFGAILVCILQIIPVLGWILAAIYALLAVGAVGLSGAGTSVDWLLRRTEAEPLRRSAGPATGSIHTP